MRHFGIEHLPDGGLDLRARAPTRWGLIAVVVATLAGVAWIALGKESELPLRVGLTVMFSGLLWIVWAVVVGAQAALAPGFRVVRTRVVVRPPVEGTYRSSPMPTVEIDGRAVADVRDVVARRVPPFRNRPGSHLVFLIAAGTAYQVDAWNGSDGAPALALARTLRRALRLAPAEPPLHTMSFDWFGMWGFLLVLALLVDVAALIALVIWTSNPHDASLAIERGLVGAGAIAVAALVHRGGMPLVFRRPAREWLAEEFRL